MSPTYKLTYFDIQGVGEPLRVLLHYGNLEFEDKRVAFEDWPKLKPTFPLGQLPVLEHNGEVYYQSRAIARFLAKKVKLVGKDEIEDLKIDAAVDAIYDFLNAIQQYYYQPDEKIKEILRKPLYGETLPYYLEKFDNLAKINGGYFVNGKLTWADLIFTGFLDYMNHLTGQNLIANSPNLQKLKQNVVQVPNIKKYMEIRSNKH